MLKHYINTREALLRLRTDKDGVVSFEYVIVAALVIAAVAAVFTGTGAGTIQGALNQGLTAITNAMTAAV